MEDEPDSEDDEITLTASIMMAMNESVGYVANFSKYVGNLSYDNYNLQYYPKIVSPCDIYNNKKSDTVDCMETPFPTRNLMAFHFRLPLLNPSFIEDEVFNATIDGKDEDEENETSGNTRVKRISVEDAIHQEKRIVFTDAIMSLLKELHGSICK